MSQVMWTPTKESIRSSLMWQFRDQVLENTALKDETYHSLHQWSVHNRETFWKLLWECSDLVVHEEPQAILENDKMPGSQWFRGARLNFAENLLKFRDTSTALIFANETGVVTQLTYEKLAQEVARVARGLRDLDVVAGDRVAGFLPNIPETVIAMLATASLGAIWSSCSPDFGFSGVMDRFKQIEPKVLFAADQVLYNGKWHSTLEKVRQIQASLQSLQEVVVITYPGSSGEQSEYTNFKNLGEPGELSFNPLPFDHPLYIMYSSGTTGVPKCIVHGAGGTLLAHVKEHRLHGNLMRGDVLFYYTTCGWMMWNWLVSGLSQGATVVLYDGSPLHPDPGVLFRLSEDAGITHFGTSPKFISSVMKSGYEPAQSHDLTKLKTIFSTGAPLLPEHYEWVYSQWKEDVQLASISGGTDIIGCFMLGNPFDPVRVGEIQAPGLGLDVQAWDESQKALVSEKGELVCAQSFPNMPVGFWGDTDQQKYQKAYFEKFPGVWWHGDFIEITEHGGVIVYGRSDATLNPGGVRIGTAEIYRQVETFAWVKDSLVIGVPKEDDIDVCLYVVIEGDLTEERLSEMRAQIRQGASPRHVPAKIFQVPDIPRTLSGKKVEKAVLNQVLGREVSNRDALANPEALDAFTRLC